MKNLTIYVGKNVETLKFHTGSSIPRIESGEVFIHMIEDTARNCPYGDRSDSVFSEEIIVDMKYTLPHWNMHISTHKACLFNLVGDLIENGAIEPEGVKVILLDEDNKPVSECGYTEDGYLTEGWIAGFMNSTGDEWKKLK